MKLKIFIIISMLPLFSAMAAVPAWTVSDAEYRLTAKTDNPALTGYIDLSQYVLPEKLDNGIDVRDEKGGKIPYFLYKNFGLFFGPAAKSPLRHIYFGFKKPMEAPPWPKELGSVPENYRLRIRVFHAGMQYFTEQQWFERQQTYINERYKRVSNWMMEYLISQSWARYYDRYFYPRSKDVKSYLNYERLNKDWDKPYDVEDYLAWRNPSSYRRSTGWVEYQCRLKGAGFMKYDDLRLEWAVKRLKRLWTIREKELIKTEVNSKGAPERDMINIFEKRKVAEARDNWTQTLLDKGIFDMKNNFAAGINGTLLIPADGDYEFAVNTSSSTLLLIDDKIEINWYGEHERSPGWEKTAKVNLKRGMHSFKFYYQKNLAITFAACAWEKPGDREFTIIQDDNFSPGWPCVVESCTGRNGKNYPLVTKTGSCILFTGKREKCLWEKFTVTDGAHGGCSWDVNGQIFSGKNIDLIFKDGEEDRIMLVPEDKNWSPMRLGRLDDGREKPFSRPDLALKLWTPDFIFDDETLDLFVEVNSKLPFAVECYLDTVASPANSMFVNGREKISLPGKPVSEQNRFIPDSVSKKQIVLKGEELKQKTEAAFNLKLPNMPFDSKRIKFIKVPDLPPMVTGASELHDSSGDIIIPVIHRPELSEIRKWELPATVMNRLAGTSKLLVVADDFACGSNTFSAMLQELLSQEEIELEFIPWRNSGNNRLLENFASTLPFILKSDADAAIIIPPVRELHDGIPVRNQYRMLAALISAFKGRNLMLATPFPPVNPTPQEEELSNEVKRLAREYGAAVLDLNYYIKENSDWQKSYRTVPENDRSLELLPVQNIEGVCRIIAKELR
ncbi:MAG: PA14 domain-containing protein [Lentisphaerota bacterium]